MKVLLKIRILPPFEGKKSQNMAQLFGGDKEKFFPLKSTSSRNSLQENVHRISSPNLNIPAAFIH